jgi:hypothetical protein
MHNRLPILPLGSGIRLNEQYVLDSSGTDGF